MVLKFAYFVELKIGCQPAKFRCYKLSESSFSKGFEKHSYDVIMMSFHHVGLPNLHIM